MKMYLISVIVLVFLAGTACQEKIDIEMEKEAIVAIIEQEFDSYNARDLDQQSKFFLQDESIMMQYSGEGSSGIAFGWEDISAGFKRFYEINLLILVKFLRGLRQ